MRGFVALGLSLFLFGAVCSAQQQSSAELKTAEVAAVLASASERKVVVEAAAAPVSSEFAMIPVQPVQPVAISNPMPPPKKPHSFFDRKNWALTTMTISAALADGITTQHALHTTRTSYSTVNGVQMTTVTTYTELNPFAKPLVNRGWGGQIAATAITASADLGFRAYLHKRGNHRLERIVPFAFAATSAAFAAHNAGHW